MSVKISEITELDSEASNPVMLLNMYKYWSQLFGAKGFRARDHTYPAMDYDGANVLYLAGEQQLYRAYIGGIDAERNSLRAMNRPSDEQLRTYVAKRNRVTGKMRLVEVETCHVEHASHDQKRVASSSAEPLDIRTLRMLQSKFNSKSSQAALKRMHSQHFDLGIMDTKLRQTIADCAVQDGKTSKTVPAVATAESDGALAQLEQMIRAKANPNATRLCDLYSAESLIGTEVLRRLTKAATHLLQTAPEELSMASEYLENRVKTLMQSPDVTAESTVNEARICLFMDVLLRLMRQKDNRIRTQRENISPFTPVLNEHIRKEFMQYAFHSSSDRPSVTKYTRDKALMYYLALAFVVEGQNMVSVKNIHSSLRVSKSEMIMFARAIGVRYNPTTDQFSMGTVVKTEVMDDDMQLKLALSSNSKRSRR